MRKTTRFWLAVSAAVMLLCLFSAFGIADDSQEMDVSKQGKWTFSTDHKVGDQTLKPGDYEVNHRARGSDHFIHFTSVDKSSAEVVVPVQCKLEPSGRKMKESRALIVTEAGVKRIVNLKVRGNNAAFVF